MPTILYPPESVLVPLSEIDLTKRYRKDYGNVQDMADSITEFGLIHPPTVAPHPNPDSGYKWILLAGGRRTAGMQLLGVDPIPVVTRTDVAPEKYLEIELEENEQRLGMAWQEKIKLFGDSLNLRKRLVLATNTRWTQKMAGSFFNVSHTHVANSMLVYDLLVSNDPEILAAPNVTEAINIAIAKKELEAQQELAKRNSSFIFVEQEVPAPGAKTTTPPSFKPIAQPDEVSRFLTPLTDTPASSLQQTGKVQPDMKRFELSKRFILGDSVREVMPGFPPNKFDHIVTDPPYGISMENMKNIQDIGTVAEQHQVEENLELLGLFFKQAFRVLRQNGFCVVWYDLDNHQYVQELARDAGFTVQRWPIYWIKTHLCKNDSAQFNFTKSVETALVCRKGLATLVRPQINNYIVADGSLEQKMYNNPFAKPFAVWKFIYDAIALPGQEVLDPFAGEFSSAHAALNLGLLPTCIEKMEIHFTKGSNDIRKKLTDMTGGNIIFE